MCKRGGSTTQQCGRGSKSPPPESYSTDDSLDPMQILSGWSLQEWRQMPIRSFFTPSTTLRSAVCSPKGCQPFKETGDSRSLIPCKFYLQGSCCSGSECHHAHPEQGVIETAEPTEEFDVSLKQLPHFVIDLTHLVRSGERFLLPDHVWSRRKFP